MGVCRGEAEGERDALGIGDQVALGACSARSVGLGPVASPPFWREPTHCPRKPGSNRWHRPGPGGRAGRDAAFSRRRPLASCAAAASTSCPVESSASEDEIAAERAAAKTTSVVAFTRKRPARQPFPDHLPRERVVEAGPTTCLCCGSPRLRKLGEDVTETLEVIPRRWKVIQHVREKFTCRDCEKISQAPAPFM